MEPESCFLSYVPAASQLTVGHCPDQSEQGPCVSTVLKADFLWVNLWHSACLLKSNKNMCGFAFLCVFGSGFKVGSRVKSCRNHMDTRLCFSLTNVVCISRQHLSTQQVKLCTQQVTQPWPSLQNQQHICCKSKNEASLQMNNWHKHYIQLKCTLSLQKQEANYIW